ncbi:MAG: antitoxin family protein [Nitrospirae bacterium]|nr:antitoxin family protein [Nitrospirota bacterium]
MHRTIEAIYENGVFKPAKKIRLRDKQKVQIQILAKDGWQIRFDKALKAVRAKTAGFPTEEIEADVKEAIKEVRNRKRAC